MKQLTKKKDIRFFKWRFVFVLIVFLLATAALVARLIYLTVFEHKFLLKQGNARSLRTVDVSAYRGMILDRHNNPLAVSTPVDSVWINPQDFSNTKEDILKIAHLLHLPVSHIHYILKHNAAREFAYLKRRIDPSLAQKIQALTVPGVYLKREYKRYYPMGEGVAQVLGFTNVDDKGQEGLELAYNSWLRGKPGKEKVLKDRYGHVVAVLSELEAAKPGHDLTLSLDNRLQFLAYQALKETIKKYQAKSGSVVILNPKTGEVLAMADQPSFNPNKKLPADHGQFRNRAVTDMFEPGSTMKAFSLASALNSGKYKPDTLIRTSPGWFKIGTNKVRDEHDNGTITVREVLQKSSNVGVAKITLSLPPDHLISLLRRVGFGERTGSGFPGESPGKLIYPAVWRPFVLATLAFGYGISVTPLQLAQAYTVIANDGLRCPVTFLKREHAIQCPRAMRKKAAHGMLAMLKSVVRPSGTGMRARVAHYQVAGKTGTAYIVGHHGYDKKQHMSSFVGIAPVTNPKLVVAVVIRNPQKAYYGGVVAAPAFAKIMSNSLRILNIPPDKITKRA